MELKELEALLSRIKYKNWKIKIESLFSTYIQLEFQDGDEVWTSRKWYISTHMTPSEVVQTAFLAIKTAEEHEMREKFLFDNHAIFGPHFDVFSMVDLIETNKLVLDVRQ